MPRRSISPELVGDIVTHWHRLAERRKTVVFATSVAHAIHLKDEFVKSGVRPSISTAQTPKDERDEILKRLSRGDLELVTNCMVLTEGWDMPDVSCCVLARPTKSMGLYRQMAGRVIRPAPGKTDALILDHAGAVFQHGFVEDPVIWTLDPDTKAETPAHVASGLAIEPPSARVLAMLGDPHGRQAMPRMRLPAEAARRISPRPSTAISPISIAMAASIPMPTAGAEARISSHARPIAAERGYKAGWAAHKFKEKFGTWPLDPRHAATSRTPRYRLGSVTPHRLCQGMQKAAANG